MNILTERDITADVAKRLRIEAGLSQKQFWESVGSNQGSGHWFEAGKRKGIPKTIRILIFLRYVAKINLDVSTPESAALAVKMGSDFSAKIEALRAEVEAKKAQQRARDLAVKAGLAA